MWLVVMFDLPTKTNSDKQRYRHFRNLLLDEGFRMLQYSVYARHLATRERTDAKTDRILRNIPYRGEVRLLKVTEAQYSRMQIISNYKRRRPESEPPQLELW